MKMSIFVLGFIIVSTLALTSCKKDYNCKCTIYFENGGNLESSNVVKGKQIADASSACNKIGKDDAEVQTEEVKSYECGLYD